MSTPHNQAINGEIAKTVLMPGDPLRAKFIAENFLENPVLFNTVRNMFGYTGTYNGKKVSVMGSGMGMPSIGIYSYELYTQYDVENIIRVGSAGAYSAELNVFDIMLVTGAYSESSYAKTQCGCNDEIILPSVMLNDKIKQSAKNQDIKIKEGIIHSSDVFYRAEDENLQIPYWQTLCKEKHCLAVEMESFALFHNANVTGKNAACVVTISDNFVNQEVTTAQQREQGFVQMMNLALGSV